MCVLYVSFGSKVRPIIFGCVAMDSAVFAMNLMIVPHILVCCSFVTSMCMFIVSKALLISSATVIVRAGGAI